MASVSMKEVVLEAIKVAEQDEDALDVELESLLLKPYPTKVGQDN